MQTLSDKLGDNQYGTCLVTCHDCGEDFEIKLERKSEDTMEYSGGIIAKNKHNGEYLFKCLTCNNEDPINFGTNCEVYSRVVGYLRPIGNWNNAKRAEYCKRVNYVMPTEDTNEEK